MTILGIDTSTAVKTVAILKNDNKIIEYFLDDVKNHSESLLPIINQLLSDVKLSMEDIDMIAVGNGPGSYTGLRIGAATVKGLAYGRNIPIIKVSSLDALAKNIDFTDYYVCPILDARRNEVYTALYKGNEKLRNEECIKLDELLDILDNMIKSGEKVVFVGDAAEKFFDKISEKLNDKVIKAPINLVGMRGSSVILKALETGEKTDAVSYVPNYLKEPFINSKGDK